MDANKLKVLQDINYKVRKVCGNCKHSRFSSTGANFGTCMIQKYAHLKHTGDLRELSINNFGHCNKHEWAEQIESFQLGGFTQLKEK